MSRMWVFFWEEHECHFTVFQTVMCSKISNNSLKDRPLKSWSLLSRTITFEKPLFLRDHYFWGIMTFQGLYILLSKNHYVWETITLEGPLLFWGTMNFEGLSWGTITLRDPYFWGTVILYVQLFIRKMRKREVTFKR